MVQLHGPRPVASAIGELDRSLSAFTSVREEHVVYDPMRLRDSACVRCGLGLRCRSMGTLVSIVDVVVLLLFIIHIPRMVWREEPRGIGSLLLSICVALAVITLACVSFVTYAGFFTSVTAQAIWLVILLVMANFFRISWTNKPTA